MFKRLFGKKDKFFLELKEDATKAVGQAVEQAEKAIDKTTETLSHVVESVETKIAESAPEEKVASAKAARKSFLPFIGQPKEEKTSVKEKKAKGKKEAKPVETKPSPAPTPASSQNGKVDPQDVAFASKYPITSSLSRRTPGPSLNSFKEMARQVKVPKRKG